MKKIQITETMLTNLIKQVISERKQIKEQDSAFNWEHPSDGWDIQRDAREKGKYCKKSYMKDGQPSHFEGQHCVVETNWYDWESSPTPKTMGTSTQGKWKCGVGCQPTRSIRWVK
jgi:hypothetical protein